ncbi:MAG TPA: hypothetical protein P5550_05695 [Bacteroidales bacterium]|nr:hypothetical protein [Bacteroidales bacterium]HRZ76432.1 hypothetical protein [Bacteroidales bacterium]
MEDLLYILAVLGWVAYSFYKNSKKVKEKRPTISRPASQREEPVKEHPDVRDILRELLGEQEVRVPAPAPTPVTVAPRPEPLSMESTGEAFPYDPQQEQFSWDAMYEEKKGSKASGLAEREAVKYHSSPLLAGEQKVRKMSRFDLRRAVILSEILNRPYDESRLSGGYPRG